MQRAVLALALLAPATAHAQGVGIPELGLEAPSPALGGLAVRPEPALDGIRYDAETDRPAGALVDWYPGLGGFRLSGGLRVNTNSMDLGTTLAQPVNSGGSAYTPTQVGRLSGSVEYNRFAPYLGIGWQGAMMGGRMLIGLDLGALYQGKPDVQLTATGTGANPALADDLTRQANAIENNLGGFKLLPVISLTFTYRF